MVPTGIVLMEVPGCTIEGNRVYSSARFVHSGGEHTLTTGSTIRVGPQEEHMIVLHVEEAFHVAPAEAAAAVDEEGGAPVTAAVPFLQGKKIERKLD